MRLAFTRLRTLASIVLAAVFAGAMHAQVTPAPAIKALHPVAARQDTETAAERDLRMQWWREARFGMFIHWGLYAEPAGLWHGKTSGDYGEWIMNEASIPVAEYKALAPKFNPTAFSAHDIVALAKSAGMKYIVITAKHHDGFAMFASKADGFNIVDATPFHRDPLAELAVECRKQGIKLGFYYSQAQDWTAPGGAAKKKKDHQPPSFHWDKAQDGDFARYIETKALPQIEELLSNYGDFPAVVWFDTPTQNMTPELAAKIVTVLNQHPNLIWNNRLGGGYPGDTETPEQKIPAQGFPGRDWESCMTINDTWGYKSGDLDFKSADTLLRNLIDIASKGGNYLLNIGPDATGAVPAPEVERLLAMGKWLDVNHEAIYGTRPTLFTGPPVAAEGPGTPPKKLPITGWRSTTAPDKIYLEIFDWPAGTFHLDQAPRTVTGAYLLADPAHKPLTVKQTSAGIDVSLPAQPLDPVATVVVLTTR